MRLVLLCAALLLCRCSSHTIYHTGPRTIASPRIVKVLDEALSWPRPAGVPALKGAMLLRDGAPIRAPELAITRAILRTNPRIAPTDALFFAVLTCRAAAANLLPPEFLAATLLQESAYDPRAISVAGAIGLAQFMPDTAAGVGLDPYDPVASIAAAGSLIGGYVAAYRDVYADPYSAALAAYNAGPVAVSEYRGIPPYAETREYIDLIFDRWARMASYEVGAGDRRPSLNRSRTP